MGLDSRNSLERSLGGIVDALLVIWVTADEGTEPASNFRENLRVEERHPSENGSVVLFCLAEKSSLLVLGGD